MKAAARKARSSPTHPPPSPLPTHRPSPRAPAAPAAWWSSNCPAHSQPLCRSPPAGTGRPARLPGLAPCYLCCTPCCGAARAPSGCPEPSRPAGGRGAGEAAPQPEVLQGSFAGEEPPFRTTDLVKKYKIQSTGSKREGFSRWGMALGTFRSPGSRDRGQQPRSRPPLTPRSLSFGNARLAYR